VGLATNVADDARAALQGPRVDLAEVLVQRLLPRKCAPAFSEAAAENLAIQTTAVTSITQLSRGQNVPPGVNFCAAKNKPQSNQRILNEL
jgi:hypothetical protein